MNIKPLGNRVVLKFVEAEELSAGGIVLTGESKQKSQHGIVVALGEDCHNNTAELGSKTVLLEGRTVVYGSEVEAVEKFEGSDYLIMKESNILAVIEK